MFLMFSIRNARSYSLKQPLARIQLSCESFLNRMPYEIRSLSRGPDSSTNIRTSFRSHLPRPSRMILLQKVSRFLSVLSFPTSAYIPHPGERVENVEPERVSWPLVTIKTLAPASQAARAARIPAAPAPMTNTSIDSVSIPKYLCHVKSSFS